VIALLASLALGQEAPLEIEVVGEVEIRDARSAVVRAAEEVGWDGVERRGVVVLRPPASWMGRAKLTSDGELLFGRPVLALAAVEAQPVWSPEENPNLATPAGLTTGPGDFRGPPAPTAGPRFWFLPSRGRLDGAQQRLLTAIDDELTAYARIIRAARASARPAPPPPPPPR
jgi:hypothetical protein